MRERDPLGFHPAFTGLLIGGVGPTRAFSERFKTITEYVMVAHSQCASEPSKQFRKWDGATPFVIHPLWCAVTLLTETALSEMLRHRGAIALLQHDILEDTTSLLHAFTTYEERVLVREMTFESFEEEVELVWQYSPECRLLKCYDKVSNLLDSNWRTDKREEYVAYTRRLIDEAHKRYGELNIVKIAQAVIG